MASLKNFYLIVRDAKDGWKVVTRQDRRAMFYGTHAECVEWIEHNGHDESL